MDSPATPIRSCGAANLLLVFYDADGPIAFKDRVGDVVDRGDPFCTRRGHDVLPIYLHALHYLQLPLSIFQQGQRGAVDDGAQAWIFAFDARYQPMHQSNGKNRRGAVGDRAVFPDRAQDDDSPDQEDNNELKQRQLSSRAPAKHPHDEEKKEISSNCVNDGRQAMFLYGTTTTLACTGWEPTTPMVKS
jgi:hypothetical protein